MANENDKPYTPKHAVPSSEPDIDFAADQADAAWDDAEQVDAAWADAAQPDAAWAEDESSDIDRDFDTDQMKSLAYLYEGEHGASSNAGAASSRAPRAANDAAANEGPRHVGRTQHAADFTASKYLGADALKSSRQRKSSDYKDPSPQAGKPGSYSARHSSEAPRQAAPKTQVISSAEETVVADGTPAEQTRLIADVAPTDQTVVAPRAASHAPVQGRGGAVNYAQPVPVKKKSKAPRVIGIIVILLVVAIAICAGLMFKSVKAVQADAIELNKVISTLSDDFRIGAFDKLSQSVDDITEISGRMRKETSSPLWAVASKMPIVGTDAGNAIVLCETIDDLSRDVLDPLADDLPNMTTMSEAEQAAFAVKATDYVNKLETARTTISSLDEGGVDQVNSAIDKAEDLIEKAEILLGG